MVNYSIDEICEKVQDLVETYCTDDPEEICQMLDIVITERDFGKSETSIRGLVTRIPAFEMTCIVLNSSLSDLARKFYLAHELGHSVLHISEGIERIADFGMLDNTDTLEVEANLFAAELLLGDSDDVMDDLKTYRMTYFQYAAMRNVPYELLAYKIRIMRHQGYRLRELPIPPDSRFLSKVNGVYD